MNCKKWTALLVALLILFSVSGSFAMDSYYVKTSNGKSLNLRSSPERGDNVIASIPYGAQVEAIDVCMDGTWLNVAYGNTYGWVMIRYLSSNQPGPRPTSRPSPQPTAKPVARDTSIDYSSFADVNYYATVRASVSHGIVHMRWAPSKQIAIKRDYDDGSLLQVIAQNSQWAQVRDPDTGEVGYMMRNFLQDNVGLTPTTTTESSDVDG